MKSYFRIIVIVLSLATIVRAEIKLPAIFADNMVLQRETEVKIWGWANPVSSVKVFTSWNKKNYKAKANNKGEWALKIETPKAGGPYTVTISDGKTISLQNILIGEVWVCSGQSNMEMPMKGFYGQPVEGGLDDIIRSTNKNIRLFTVGRQSTAKPKENCVGDWNEANPKSVNNFSATAYYYGRLLNEITGVPIGLIHSSWGGTSIESWMPVNAFKDMNVQIPNTDEEIRNKNQSPTVLFNGMINPIVGYGIKGVIWYQGENNHTNPLKYPLLMKNMVDEWRNMWGVGDFSFYYVQIAPFGYIDFNSAYLREAQIKALDLISNSGIAINMDANSVDCIHPPRKKIIGERLAYLALNKDYKIDGFDYCSPMYKSMEVKGSMVELTFDVNPGQGMTSFGKEIKGFMVAGIDKRFYSGVAAISKNKIQVFSPKVEAPVSVRYAFDDTSSSEIFNLNGLPISSFRTDDWEVKK